MSQSFIPPVFINIDCTTDATHRHISRQIRNLPGKTLFSVTEEDGVSKVHKFEAVLCLFDRSVDNFDFIYACSLAVYRICTNPAFELNREKWFDLVSNPDVNFKVSIHLGYLRIVDGNLVNTRGPLIYEASRYQIQTLYSHYAGKNSYAIEKTKSLWWESNFSDLSKSFLKFHKPYSVFLSCVEIE